jgi:hypothetical protein
LHGCTGADKGPDNWVKLLEQEFVEYSVNKNRETLCKFLLKFLEIIKMHKMIAYKWSILKHKAINTIACIQFYDFNAVKHHVNIKV